MPISTVWRSRRNRTSCCSLPNTWKWNATNRLQPIRKCTLDRTFRRCSWTAILHRIRALHWLLKMPTALLRRVSTSMKSKQIGWERVTLYLSSKLSVFFSPWSLFYCLSSVHLNVSSFKRIVNDFVRYHILLTKYTQDSSLIYIW